VRGPGAEFKEWAIFIDEQGQPLTNRKAAKSALPVLAVGVAA
jgi:hypothetical protein